MKTYWELKDGGIVWHPVRGDGGHRDDIEMSGLFTSYVLTYGVDEEGFEMTAPVNSSGTSM